MRTGGWAGKTVFLFLVLVLLSGCAQASVSYSSSLNEIGVYGEHGRDLRWITAQINNDSIIRFDGDICYMNASMRLYSGCSNFYINDSTVSELRMYNYYNTVGLSAGHYLIDGVKITSWNHTEHRPANLSTTAEKNSHESVTTYQGFIRNCAFEGVKSIGVNDVRNDIYNITIVNCSKGIVAYNATDVKFYDIYASNLYGSGIEVYYPTNNTEVYNVTVLNAGDFRVPTTGKYGVYFQGVNHSSMHDIYVNGTGWSSLEATGAPASSYIDIYNATVINSGHDGIDIHYANDVNVWNTTINDSIEKNIIVTYSAGGVGTYNISFTDVYSAHHGIPPGQSSVGAGASIGEGSYNVSFLNFSSDGDGAGIIAQNTELIKMRNVSVTNIYSGISLTGTQAKNPPYTGNATLIDSDIYNTSTNLNVFYSTNTKVINTKYNPNKLSYGSGYNGEWTKLYYGDFKVVDSTGSPLTGSIELSDSSYDYAGTDAEGNDKSSFSFIGRTPFPTDRTNSIAIPHFYRNSSLYAQAAWINYSTVADISTSSGNVQLDNINPDVRWYRPNISQSKYSIVALINDSEDLHFTGYAPSPEYNNYESGDSVKFQIWTSEPASVSWKKDGQTVQTGGMIYEATVSDAPITVDIMGESATGSISKSWVIDPEQIIDPDPQGNAPLADFTSDVTTGTYPLKVSFTDTSTETPTSWYWDFDNDGFTDSRLQNPVVTYKAKGNYTVKLTVANGNGPGYETKTRYIQVIGSTPTKIPYYSAFSDWLNSFYQQYIAAFGMWLI